MSAHGLQLPDGCAANFKHIVELYYMEETMSIKKAYKITPAALNRRNIEKNVCETCSVDFLRIDA